MNEFLLRIQQIIIHTRTRTCVAWYTESYSDESRRDKKSKSNELKGSHN